MKILLFGDASNYNAALAIGLKTLGHNVTVVSDGGKWMNTARDIDIRRRGLSKFQGALLYLKFRSLQRKDLRNYDIVQLSSPSFTLLKPFRLQKIFDSIKLHNGSVFMSALGTDAFYVKALTSGNPPLRYSEWNLENQRTPWCLSEKASFDLWSIKPLLDYTDHLYSNIDGVVSALYEYHKVVQHMRPDVPLAYGGIPIDLEFNITPKKNNQKVRILLSAHKGREQEKGADILFPLVEDLSRRFADKVELLTPPNLPYNEFLTLLSGVDIVVDQLYGYSPATTALLAMARNAVAVTGGEPEFADFIGEKTPLPIINPSPFEPEKFVGELEYLIQNRDALSSMQSQAREFVHRHHNAVDVASRFIEFWTSTTK